jgi:dolichol-phosphate mannosyltransferase
MLKEKINTNNQVSIIIPTYNESKNIIKILHSIGEILPKNVSTQTIVVDDNSPDGTGKIVEDYLKNVKKIADNTIEIWDIKTSTKGF